MERAGRIGGISHSGGVAVVNGGLNTRVSSETGGVSRLPIALSTIVIDRLPKAGVRIGRLKRRSSSFTIHAVDTVYAPVRLVDDAKRARKPRRRKESALSGSSVEAAPISAANTKNLARTDKELLKLAQALENAYYNDSPLITVDTDSGNSALEDLVLQTRPIVDGSYSTCAATASSSAASTITTVQKKRGRKTAATVESLPQHPSMHMSLNSMDELSVAPSPTTLGKKGEGNLFGKRRLNLVSRIALRRKRQENAKKASDANVKVSKGGQEIWSEDAEKLINKYASSLDVGVVDWDSLNRELLTADDESNLALLMKPMKKLQKVYQSLSEEIGREPTDEEWAKATQLDVHTLKRHVLLGRAARNKLIQHNLRLVLFQAHKYHKETSSLSLFDLCQEGVSGLLHGVDKFDPKRGHRFSTYAVYWVRNSILRAQTRSGSMLRSPYNVAMHKLNIKRARLDLLVELERAATDDEVMERLGLAPDRFRDIVRSSARTKSIHQRSLVTGEEFVENIADSQSSQGHVQSSAGDAVLRLGMDDVLDSLKPKESLVLSQRFGLDGKGERTLSEIGRNLNLSREMVRRYEVCGLLKMKHPARMDYLRSYLV